MPSLNKRGAFTLLSVACLTIMVGCVIVPGLPRIAAAFGLSKEASWLVTLPSLGVVVFGPVGGWVITRLGLRNALRIGLVLYGALGMVCVWLGSPILIFADRLLLGGATVLVMASGTGLISEFYEGHTRLKMIARQGMSIELGGVIFLSVGGILASLGWQWPFLLYLMGWVFLVMVECFVPAVPVHPAQEQADAPSGMAIHKKVMDIYVAALLSMIIFFTAVISLPHRLGTLGFAETTVGYFLSGVSLVAVCAAANMPKVTRLLGEKNVLCLGFGFYAIAHAMFFTVSSTGLFIVAGILMGCGFGLTVPLVNFMIVERSHPSWRGKVLAFLSVALFLGQFLSAFLSYVPGGAMATFVAASGLALVACVGFGVSHQIHRHRKTVNTER